MNWNVYLLKSEVSNRTYIGATNNPKRRIRCHNGEICGGAKYTQTNRPWKYVCIISNLDKIPALQLEWRLKRGYNKKGKLKPISGLKKRIDNIKSLLQDEKYNNVNIQWFDL